MTTMIQPSDVTSGRALGRLFAARVRPVGGEPVTHVLLVPDGDSFKALPIVARMADKEYPAGCFILPFEESVWLPDDETPRETPAEKRARRWQQVSESTDTSGSPGPDRQPSVDDMIDFVEEWGEKGLQLIKTIRAMHTTTQRKSK